MDKMADGEVTVDRALSSNPQYIEEKNEQVLHELVKVQNEPTQNVCDNLVEACDKDILGETRNIAFKHALCRYSKVISERLGVKATPDLQLKKTHWWIK